MNIIPDMNKTAASSDPDGVNESEELRTGTQASGRVSRANRRAGVETYQNMLRILFALRDAPLTLLSDQITYVKAMTPEQIRYALRYQDSPPSIGTVRKYLRQMENQTPSQVEVIGAGKQGPTLWRLKDNSPLNRSGLSDYEAAMVCLASQLLEPLLPPQLRQPLDISRKRAEEILLNSRPIGAMPVDSPIWMLKLINRVWVEKPPAISPEVQEAVFEAVRSGKLLQMDYLSMQRKHQGKPPATVTVSPLRLVQHGDARLYLFATNIIQQDALDEHVSEPNGYRRFALHRIIHATVLDQVATIRPDLEELIDRQPGFGWTGLIHLVAMVSTGLALRLEESPLNSTQRLDRIGSQGWHQLEVDLDSNWELRWWILSNGKNIVVLEPTVLREEIADHFNAGQSQYLSFSGHQSAQDNVSI